MRHPSRSLFLLLSIASAVALAPAAFATSYVPVADVDLAASADAIAVVRVLERLAPSPAGEEPSTRWRVAVEEAVAGRLDGEIVVRVPGGTSADGTGWEVAAAPHFADGERALLFLVERGDGSWGIADLMLGAFHEVVRDGERLAVRDLADAQRVGGASAAGGEGGGDPGDLARRFDPFVAWLGDHAAGRRRAADYRVAGLAEAEAAAGLRRVSGAYELMTDGGNCGGGRLPIRWFRFDEGGSVRWSAQAAGQPGMPGGGFSELAAAFRAWNDDPGSNVRLSYLGTGGGGDGEVRFDDPRGEIDGSFNCSRGGVLAIGGPSFQCAARSSRGRQWRPAVGGKIVTQDGAGCFFGGHGGLDGAEVFAHEIGHTLGLGHSTAGGALMRASASGNGRGATLGADDRAALAAVYGSGSSAPPPAPPPPPPPATAPAAPDLLAGQPLGPRDARLSWRDRSGDETQFVVEAALAGGAMVPIGTLPAGTTAASIGGLSSGTAYWFQVRARNAAGTSAPSNRVAVTTPAEAPSCPSGKLCLAGGRFEVDVAWRNQHAGGATGVGTPVPASDDSGYFTFFHPGNVELVVKVLDGRTVNGSFWVFYGGLSDVGFELRVRDRLTGLVRTFTNPPGRICGMGETAAFPASAAGGGPWLSAAALAPSTAASIAPSSAATAAAPATAAAGACSPGGDRLCLAGGRFEVRVDWINQHGGGARGVGRPGAPVVGGDTTGVFWFFDPGNVELVAKVIDGRSVNGHFWFFYGGLSDVEYRLTVRDTWTGAVRTYRNAPGTICGQGDTAAFPGP